MSNERLSGTLLSGAETYYLCPRCNSIPCHCNPPYTLPTHYLFIGGAEGFDTWLSIEAPTSEHFDLWARSELQIFRIKNGGVEEPTSHGMWCPVKRRMR